MIIYNLGIKLMSVALHVSSLWSPKSRKWVEGRKDIFEKLDTTINPNDRICWIHAASLGEFEQGRPIIEEIKNKHPEFTILLTFFSPSGYDVKKGYRGADYIFYMPADTPSNIKKFIKIAHPEIAIIVKYEFWLNCLNELHKIGCKTYLVSSIFRRNSIFFRWYGGIFRRCLTNFKEIFVQDENSKELLSSININNVTIAGDTRFDRVAAINASTKRIPVIDKFKGDAKTFIAGSTWEPDEELLRPIIEKHKEIKFIIAPHVINKEHIKRIKDMFGNKIARYTYCSEVADYDYSDKQILLIDTIGYLSSAYRYASFAYIGGGFGVGIHNTLEAATFGLPISFGTNYRKFKEATDLISLGAACSISNSEQLETWLNGLLSNHDAYDKACKISADYINSNKGATQIIMSHIFE